MKIISPMPRGNGAYIVHKNLENRIPGYQVKGYNPRFEYCPFLMPLICSNDHADIIHTNPDYGCFFKKNKPLVVTFHGFFLDQSMQSHSSLLQRIHYRTDLRYFTSKTLEIANMVTSVSKFTAGLVRDELGYSKEIRVIYNGIDLEKFRPKKKVMKGPIRVLYAGNLSRRKGAYLLPDIAKLLDDNIVIQFTSGLRTKSLQFKSDKLINVGSIAYENMPSLYQQADLLVFPTYREGFGLVAVEAMASGLPVVASNCSSLPELVIPGKGGFLCELGNAQEFADSINLLANSVGLRKEMGQFNRARAEKYFSVSQMVGSYQRLFCELTDITW